MELEQNINNTQLKVRQNKTNRLTVSADIN